MTQVSRDIALFPSEDEAERVVAALQVMQLAGEIVREFFDNCDGQHPKKIAEFTVVSVGKTGCFIEVHPPGLAEDGVCIMTPGIEPWMFHNEGHGPEQGGRTVFIALDGEPMAPCAGDGFPMLRLLLEQGSAYFMLGGEEKPIHYAAAVGGIVNGDFKNCVVLSVDTERVLSWGPFLESVSGKNPMCFIQGPMPVLHKLRDQYPKITAGRSVHTYLSDVAAKIPAEILNHLTLGNA